MDREKIYIFKRRLTAIVQSIPFYLCRVLPISKRKIVFTTIEGTSGFACNPKYIALELRRRNRTLPQRERYELVWLVDDLEKKFPIGIRKVKNTLIRRAYELSTAAVWVDNSRKQLEVRKRKKQIYIQTWHAKLGFKPTCLDRGASFSQIAYLVSKHDSDMVDYWLSNSDWYDATLKTGSLYVGKTIRCGSPRCDILIRGRKKARQRIRKRYGMPEDEKLLLYCPTFRGGSQETKRRIEQGDHMPDMEKVLDAFERHFGGNWKALFRLHPQLTARGITNVQHWEKKETNRFVDVSSTDDMYDILAACDAFLTDYSSAAFDASVMQIPVFLYCDDLEEYEGERGRLLWDIRAIPFQESETTQGLIQRILSFDEKKYRKELEKLFQSVNLLEDGHAAERVVDFIDKELKYAKGANVME